MSSSSLVCNWLPCGWGSNIPQGIRGGQFVSNGTIGSLDIKRNGVSNMLGYYMSVIGFLLYMIGICVYNIGIYRSLLNVLYRLSCITIK